MPFYETCCRCGQLCPRELSSAEIRALDREWRNESAVLRMRSTEFDPLMITPALLFGGYMANTYNATHKEKPDPFHLNKISEDLGTFSRNVASTTESLFKWNPFVPGADSRAQTTSTEAARAESVPRRMPDTPARDAPTQRHNDENPRGDPPTRQNNFYSYEQGQNPPSN